MAERPRHKLTQRRRTATKPAKRLKNYSWDRPLEGLRNKEVGDLLGMPSGNVANAAREGKLRRHTDGSYTRESVIEYAQKRQGKLDFTLDPKPEPEPETLTGVMVPSNGHVGHESVQQLEIALLQVRLQDLTYQAGLRQIAYEREKEQTLDRIPMEQTIRAAFARVREALLNLADRLTPELTGLDDEADVHRRIDREARDMIRALQRAIEEI